jgi:deazaflavin-dependent oxidoreductase (nitroreductase family)
MWYNRVMIALLRSPLHSMLDKNMLVLTYTGRKSGKTYSTPVNFLSFEDAQGEYLLTTSYRQRTWWRNLRGGAPVTLCLHGKDRSATAVAIEDLAAVATGLASYLSQSPSIARYFDVKLDAAGKPVPQDISRAAETRVVIQTRLAS